MNHLDRCIRCPKCNTKTMRQSIGHNMVGKEYYDDRCHEYFGITELVKVWGYDVSDFYNEIGDDIIWSEVGLIVQIRETVADFAKGVAGEASTMFCEFDTVSPTFEPEWKNEFEREDAYEEVTLMQLGIPWYALEDTSVDTGATHA